MQDIRSNRLILAAMCLGTFMAVLDTSLVNLGLRRIKADLHAEIVVLQWVIDLYNLTYAAFLLTGGTLADRYGRRRLFLWGSAIFASGSLLCAIAPGAEILIFGRGIAGLGAALLLPAALAILNVTYPDAGARTRAIAIWGGMNGLAMAIGPTFGGALVDILGWRSLFYCILPVAAATLTVAALYVPESSDPRGRRLDPAGQTLAVVALVALSLALIEGPVWGWRSPAIFGCLSFAAGSAAAFLMVERRSADPLVPLRVFGEPAFSAAVADAALMTFGIYGLLFVLPLYLQSVRGASAALAGVELLPMSITFFVVSLIAGRVATAIGPRLLIGGGMTLTGLGILGLSRLSTDSGHGVIAAALFAVGVGLGSITGPIANAAVNNAPAARSGMSSGLVNVGRMLGATLGVAVLGIWFGGPAGQGTGDPQRFVDGMHTAFRWGGGAELIGAAIAFLWFRRDSLETRARRSGPEESARRG
jgi:MFS transporter, DHA2 family, methylenomycin A resistance protein